jgi:hypothetical protein
MRLSGVMKRFGQFGCALGLHPLLLFGSYVLLYAFHIRSYYEMQSGSTHSRNALRFSMNLMSVWCVLAGLGTAYLLEWLRRSRVWKNHRVKRTWILVCSVAVVLGVSYHATRCFRDDVVEDEFRMRITPSLTAARVAVRDRRNENYVLTLEPLIPQMYAEPNVEVLSFEELNAAVMDKTGFSQGLAELVYVDEEIHRTPADAERYKNQLAYLDQFPHSILARSEVYSLVRIERLPTRDDLSKNH